MTNVPPKAEPGGAGEKTPPENAASAALLKRTRGRLMRGMGASTLMLGLSYGANFLLVPLILRAWGPGGYGLWVTLFSTAAYLSLLDFGGQIFVQNLLAMNHARGKCHEFRATLSRATGLYLWLGGFVAVFWTGALLAGLSFSVPLLGRALSATEAWVLAFLGANQFLISIPFGVFVTCYRASGQFTRAAWLGNISKLLSFGLSVVVLVSGGGPALLAAVYLAVGIFSALALLVDSRRSVAQAHPLDFRWQVARQGMVLFQGSVYNWLITLAGLIIQQAPILVVAKVGSANAVALFATHRILANVSAYVSSIVSGPILPELSYRWSLQDHNGFGRMLTRTLLAVTFATGLVGLCVNFGAPYVFRYWTVDRVGFDGSLLLLMLVQGVTAAGNTTVGWALTASNRNRIYSGILISCAFLYMLTPALTVNRWGLHGMVIVNIGIDLTFLCLVLPRLVRRELSVPAWQLVRAALLALTACALAGGALFAVGRVFSGPWGGLVVFGLAIVGSGAALAFLWNRWRGHSPQSLAVAAPTSVAP